MLWKLRIKIERNIRKIHQGVAETRRHTRPGDICCAPFSGCGSQIMAAEQPGRRCCACETEPAFVDVAVKRWKSFTKQTVRRIQT